MPDWGTGFGIIMSRQILVCGVMAVKLAVLLNTEGVSPTSKELAVVTKDVVATTSHSRSQYLGEFIVTPIITDCYCEIYKLHCKT